MKVSHLTNRYLTPAVLLAFFFAPVLSTQAASLNSYTSNQVAFQIKIPSTWKFQKYSPSGVIAVDSKDPSGGSMLLVVLNKLTDSDWNELKKNPVQAVRGAFDKAGEKINSIAKYSLKNYIAVQTNIKGSDSSTVNVVTTVYYPKVEYLIYYVGPKSSFGSFQKTLDTMLQSFTVLPNVQLVIADKTYTDSKNGFLIKYPFNWSVTSQKELQSRGGSPPLFEVKNPGYDKSVSVQVGEISTLSNKDRDDTKKILTKDLSKLSKSNQAAWESVTTEGSYKQISISTYKLSDYTAARVRFKITVAGTRYTVAAIYILKQNRLILLHATAPQNNYETVSPDFDQIVQSFRFLK